MVRHVSTILKPTLSLGTLALFALLTSLSCANQGRDELTYSLTIVNNSRTDVESVGLGYTGIQSRSPAPDFQTAFAVPAGNSGTVNLALDPSSDYYVLFIFNDTLSRRIIWDQASTYEYVQLSKSGASTCTITNLQSTSVAGENSVMPYSFTWP